MPWSANQWGKIWDATYASCDKDTQDLLDVRLDILKERGNLSGRPVTAPLEAGIFELRAKDARLLFYFGEERDIIFVHGIIKKTRSVPPADIKLAKKRREEILKGAKKKNAPPN